jgi:hypothetical protein
MISSITAVSPSQFTSEFLTEYLVYVIMAVETLNAQVRARTRGEWMSAVWSLLAPGVVFHIVQGI